MKQILITQLLITLGIVIFYALKESQLAYASAFGGAIAMVNTLLHGIRLNRMRQALAKNPQQDVFKILLGAMERFVFTIFMMFVGLSMLQLEATSLLLTFGAAYIAYFIIAARIGMARV